eukprot:TRINITY_DN236_c0_g1_i2.p1 TRINITY_DN236_c0_g1~~TRINITY_DN236_c0_g1_i2.p1  ORF type:complete len:1769 (-),score=637.19 TRINITY_DN236_c0_g1_i2:119-5425(-)
MTDITEATSKTFEAAQASLFGNAKNKIDVGVSLSPFVRRYHTLTAISDDELVVIGGIRDSHRSRTASVWRFTISTNEWSALAPLPLPRSNHVAEFVKGMLYVSLGRETTIKGKTADSTTTLRYHPELNLWEIVSLHVAPTDSNVQQESVSADTCSSGAGKDANAPKTAIDAASTVVGDLFCVYGGRHFSSNKTSINTRSKYKLLIVNQLTCLNTNNLEWTAHVPPAEINPNGRYMAQMATFNGTKIWIHGGLGKGRKGDLFQFDPETSTWSVPAVNQYNGARHTFFRRSAVSWVHQSDFYVLSGYGHSSSVPLWKFGTAQVGVNNYIVINGKRFATLDDTPSDQKRITCNNRLSTLPPGWLIAADSSAARMAARFGTWGTECLVTAGGTVHSTAPFASHRDCSKSGLIVSGATYSGKSCDKGSRTKVLIEQAADGNDRNTADSSWTVISQYVVYKSKRYAVLDNTATTNRKSGCQPYPMPLPSSGGWTVASNNNDTRTVLMGGLHRFGTECVVTANGISYNTMSGALCATNMLDSANSLLAPKTCNQRVLVERPIAPGDQQSWITNMTITNTITVNGKQYATLDNDRARAGASRSCRNNVPRSIPAGWIIAPNDVDTQNALRRFKFGARCFVLADGSAVRRGSGKRCLANGGLLNIESSYVTKFCSHRVLLTRPAPVTPGKSRAGECRSFGDPHFKTFDGVKYNYYGLGDHVLAEIVSATHPFRIDVRHFKLNRASANMKLAILVPGHSIELDAHHVPLPKLTLNGTATGLLTSPLQVAPGLQIQQVGTTVPVANSGRGQGRRLPKMQFLFTFSAPFAPVTVWANIRSSNVAPWRVMDIKVNIRSVQGLPAFTTRGLCGVMDGNGANDMTSPTGQVFVKQTGQQYGQTWRKATGSVFVDDDSSVYDPNFTPASSPEFTDPKFEERARQLCSKIKDEDMFDACLFDCAITGDLTMGDIIAEIADDMEEDLLTEQLGSVDSVSVDITKTFEFANNTYATLDNTAPTVLASGCQETCIRIPSGYELASDCATSRAVIRKASWGTSCMAVSNGNGYGRRGSRCGSRLLEFHNRDTQPCVMVSQCDSRVLIIKQTIEGSSGFRNGGFNDKAAGHNLAEYWTANGGGYTLEEPGYANSKYSIRVDAISMTSSYGAFQYVSVEQKVSQPFSICGWSKAQNVRSLTGKPSADYAVYTDLEFTDGTRKQGRYFREFDIGTHGWQQRCVNVKEQKPVKSMFVYALCRRVTGTVWFDEFEMTVSENSGNLLANPTMDTDQGWIEFGDGFTSNSQSDHSDLGDGGSCLGMINNADDQTRGAFQVVKMDPNLQHAEDGENLMLTVGGWARATGVGGAKDANFALHVDVRYANNETLYGQVAPFSTGTHGWEYQEIKISLGGVIQSFQVVAVFRNHTGSVCFDDLSATLTSEPALSAPGMSTGDPHELTLDGAFFTFNSLGEYVLFRDDVVELHTRHAKAGGAAVNEAMAVRYNGVDVVEIIRSTGTQLPTILLNGDEVTVDTDEGLLLGDGDGSVAMTSYATRSMTYAIRFASGHEINVDVMVSPFNVQYMEIYLRLPSSSHGQGEGLFGNYDGSADNDLVNTETGDVVDVAKATAQEILEAAESWVVNDRDSLFTAAPAAPDFTYQPKTIDDYPENEVKTAQTACASVANNNNIFQSCVLDVLATGDVSFASSASVVSAASGVSAPMATGFEKNPVVESNDAVETVKKTVLPAEDPWNGLRIGGIIAGVIIVALVIAGTVKYRQIRKEEKENTRTRVSSV